MNINLFDTNVEELKEKLLGTNWADRNGDTRTVTDVYVDGWEGSYCVKWNDGTWNRVEQLLAYGKQVNN